MGRTLYVGNLPYEITQEELTKVFATFGSVESVKIITDTTAGLPDRIAQKYQIPVIPQVINFGNETFYEGIDLLCRGLAMRVEHTQIARLRQRTKPRRVVLHGVARHDTDPQATR